MSGSLRLHELQHWRFPCPSLSPGVCSDSCPLSQCCCLTISSLPPSSPALSLSQHHGLFQGVSSSHQVAKVLEFQHQSQSFQWIFRVDFLDWFWSPCSPRNSQEFSPAPQLESINSLALSLLYGPTLTSVHDYRKNHSFDYTVSVLSFVLGPHPYHLIYPFLKNIFSFALNYLPKGPVSKYNHMWG